MSYHVDKFLNRGRERDGGGGANPKGDPVNVVTPSQLGVASVEWKNGGIYEVTIPEEVDDPIIDLTAPDGAAGISTFELHIIMPNPAVAFTFGTNGADQLWPDYDGVYDLGNTPPSFADGARRYVVVCRYITATDTYLCNLAYTVVEQGV